MERPLLNLNKLSFLIAFGVVLFSGILFEKNYEPSKGIKGALVCLMNGERKVELTSRSIRYLGNGEWKILTPANKYTIFVKGQFEDCFIAPVLETDTFPNMAPMPPAEQSRDSDKHDV